MGALQEIADEVHSLLTGFGLTSSRSAWLKDGTDADDLSIILDGATVSMGEGVAEIEDELVYVRQYVSESNALLVAPDGRGYDGTTGASHPAGTRVRLEPPYPKVAIKRAVNNAIARCWPVIWGTGVEEFTFNSSRLTYELPADAVRILGVSYESWGSTGVWPPLHAYSFDGDANAVDYASGKTITLHEAPAIGRTVRVLYAKVPAPLDESDVLFSATGLSDTARYAVVLGTVSQLLRFSDPVRLSVASAEADELDTKKLIGNALKFSNDFEANFQNELKNEAMRLRQTYPARVVRKRS